MRASGLGAEVDKALKARKVWPFPSSADGDNSGFNERKTICLEEKFSLWKSTDRKEKNSDWLLLNGKCLLYSEYISFY